MADHSKEILTDNTKIKYCTQCKPCANWGNKGDPFSNQFDKSCCDEFPYPGMKPIGVINNYDQCMKFRKRKST